MDWNHQDPKVSWLPIDLFNDTEFDEIPDRIYAAKIKADEEKNKIIKGFIEDQVSTRPEFEI